MAVKRSEKLLVTVNPELLSEYLVKRWARREQSAVAEADQLFRREGMDQDAIAAEAIAARFGIFESIERMIMQTESRRDKTLREIDRRRDGIAQRFREAATQIEDVEFREIPSLEAAE
jgi:hypothetical protein